MWKNQFPWKKKSDTVKSTLEKKPKQPFIKIQITKSVKSRGTKVINKLLHKFEKVSVTNFIQL